MIDDGVYGLPAPMICIACTLGRHELCTHPPHVVCIGEEPKHDH